MTPNTPIKSSKTLFQIYKFLSNYTPEFDYDRNFIESYLDTNYQKLTRRPLFSRSGASNTLNVSQFISWLKSPLAAVSVAWLNSELVILGNVTIKTAHVIGKLNPRTGLIVPCSATVDVDNLTPASKNGVDYFFSCMLKSNMQVDEISLTLVAKYIPAPFQKIIFRAHDYSTVGLGVVRQVYEDGEVELYCYYIYASNDRGEAIGYSMHETGVVNLRDFVFEDMLDDKGRSSSFNGVSCLRRMNRELEKKGKIWKDKLKRIEPVRPRAAKGEKYWYISDKLVVVQDRERETPTCHKRYLAGNYFTDVQSAHLMLNKWADAIHDFLASDSWPLMEVE